MRLVERLPPVALLAKSAAIVLIAVVPVGLAWWLVEGQIAVAVYLGMTFMTVAAGRLPLLEQIWVGLSAGLAAAVGALVAGNTPLLLVTVVTACALQWVFNQRSVGVAALLPSNLLLYAVLTPDSAVAVAAANWLGAAVVIVVAAVIRMRFTTEPAPGRDAAVHAAALACGCVLLIGLTRAFDLPRGNWAVLTLCLVFVPASGATRARVVHRVLGTTAGATAAVAIAVAAPPTLCLVLAALCAVLTVTYALVPDDLLYAAFLTPTVLLLFSSGRAHATAEIAVQRLGMTVVGGGLAIVLVGVMALLPGRWRQCPPW
ncbi:FUSC family protein [Streptomyces sp. ALB3]|uniref:FUSC family protein n=1 Tax=Streptomyces sp. ALB3 TaxID=3374278 RepID=UPI0037B2D802